MLLIVCIICFNNGNDSEKTDLKTENVIKNINEEKSVLLYLTADYVNCEMCYMGDSMINFYTKKYNLDIVKYNINKESDFDKILEKTDIDKKNIYLPSLIYIKGGISTTYNEIAYNEDELKKIFIKLNYISEKSDYNFEEDIDNDKLLKLIGKTENNLFLLLASNEKAYKKRGILSKLSYNYKFNYYLLNFSKPSIFSMLDSLERINTDLPKDIFITNSGKIIASTNSADEEKIKTFLEKYNIIR